MQSRSLDRLSSAVGAPGHEADDSCVSITRDGLFGVDFVLFIYNLRQKL